MLGTLNTSSPPDHAEAPSDHVPVLSHYSSKTEFLSYVLLYLMKMPFPPVTSPRSLSSSGKEKLSDSLLVLPVKTVEEKSSVKERLRKLSKKATPHKSKLPTSRATAGLRLEGKSAWIMTPRPADSSSPTTPTSSKSSSGISVSATSTFATNSKNASATNTSTTSGKRISASSMSAKSISMNIIPDSCSPRASLRCSGPVHEEKNGEAMSFSLNLTPEATLLLQKRSREKQLRAARSGSGSESTQHRKDLAGQPCSRSNLPLVKISLLNDRHRYDDVEYEEEEQRGVDQSVLLKCSEWLRGVESAAGAASLGTADKISQKSI